ncbi:hypothetical protein AB0G60_28370 [Streptomyces angustmyceticus]|uniref:Uncharacterized protein n=1 Tax=Streptomyces angustmyceticus TaxID=285578 RepID=A0A5J4LWP5_9ACTN|nr:hypothetical protein [Streptomyces angustmyceticus]UAL69516.1 hypothetical protein K7396_25740 [Streptomyces angustmyceticus]GES34735.1 hypothetical protein San01_72230 [Streptomyces angustmyceticus]
MHEQGKAAAWCGRLPLFAAVLTGVLTSALPGLPGAGAPARRRASGPAGVPRGGLARGPWPISRAPRPTLLARLSVPRA